MTLYSVTCMNALLRWKALKMYVDAELYGLDHSQPETPYQTGYRDALREIQKQMEK